MNIQIYFNNKFIELSSNDIQNSQNQAIKKSYLLNDNKLNFNKIIDEFLFDPSNDNIKIVSSDLNSLLELFKSKFYYIEAAGGFIEKDNEFLFIHRQGIWDLPKGKLEKGETIKNAAIRECEEECGIKQLSITKQLSSSFHLYKYKKGFALKQSYWFYMKSDYSKKLTPQLEEDIDEVKWFSKHEIETIIIKHTYYTIRDVINEALQISAK
jgi:8-oxo-dGTP pyrophosphatase MutT (NUDIX family)